MYSWASLVECRDSLTDKVLLGILGRTTDVVAPFCHADVVSPRCL